MEIVMFVLKKLADLFLFLWAGQFALIVVAIVLAFVVGAYKVAYILTGEKVWAAILGTVFVALIALSFIFDPYPIGDIPFARPRWR